MKGFERKEILFLNVGDLPRKAQDLLYEKEYRGDYNRYWSEFDPSDKQDYSDTLTQENLEQYWKDQVETNEFDGDLEDFIREYNLEFDVWLINCGYDFKGVKEIIINFG
jgi:hypothetical protein